MAFRIHLTGTTVAFSVAAAMAIATGLASAKGAATQAGALALTPAVGFDMEIGGQRAMGFFMTEARACAMTLISVPLEPAGHRTIEPARLEFLLENNTDASFKTPEGPALTFRCEQAGKQLSISGAPEATS